MAGNRIVLSGPLTFQGIAPTFSHDPKAIMVLVPSTIEELRLDSCVIHDHDDTLSLPCLRIVRIRDTTMEIPRPVMVVPFNDRAQALEVIELRENCWPGYPWPTQHADYIQSHAETLQELNLFGVYELQLLQSLRLAAFRRLSRLAIGNLPFDHHCVKLLGDIPSSLQLLSVNWQTHHGVLYFRDPEFMERYLRDDAKIEDSRRHGRRMWIRVVGRAPEALKSLSCKWKIDLLERENGGGLGILDDAGCPPLPSQAVASLPFALVVAQY
ncbi:hypothetical protein PUNSTDRAFT_47931 [Punctularia strigosozonata HHB-11173 SS5]|uniref:F-box domain-containing protein n=1 Tax=Punctularia strigosozonata (strain HHB-11173) TaxID=741275 RepID=R7S3E8_PUNST|nr:uncharacterized protein PUNSTDRAFT_47931 [Punctularia strigosozonata HHB-11173 SS5]EIN03741.1 hypothetical protein PUNSTDRAFT_47931 [Punctularia strigosozonata HHB-11173 SS5]